jgi:heptosyltransferase-2
MKINKFNTDKKSPLLRQAQHGAFGGVGEASGKAFKILVIQQKMIGDVLTSSIICENLKRNFPDAEIHYVINRFTIPVVENNPYIDKFVVFEDEYKQSKLRFYRFLKQVAKSNYTHVFDAYGKLESLLISKFSKAKFKYGFRKSYTSFYYTNTVKMTNDVKTEAGSAIENRLRLLQLMDGVEILNDKPKIYLTESEVEESQNTFKSLNIKPNDCIMISALGSGMKKSYPLDYLAEILDLIVEKTDKSLILNYMPSQQKHIDELLDFCAEKTKANIVEGISMKSLKAFIKICSQCAAIIGNEGGSTNMAKALGVPSFSIFSPWVTKEGWNSFEQTYQNDSVHLIDYKPHLYKKPPKKYKEQSLEFYKFLKPELIKPKLKSFLEKLN